MTTKSEYESLVEKCLNTFSEKEIIKSILFGKSSLDKDLCEGLYKAPSKDKLFSLKKVVKNCNFGMSSELAQAIGTVVVQALQENAKEDEEQDVDLDGLLDEDDDYEKSTRSTEDLSMNEPLRAKDLSAEEDELSSMSNHSFSNNSDNTSRYTKVKQILNGCF